MKACLKICVVAALVAAAAPVSAADKTFLGRWTVTASQPAPWSEPPVPSDQKALMGKAVTFRPDRIMAPPPLACRKPVYAMKAYSPDMLFQGGLHDPTRQAPALGFKQQSVPTLETGCEGAIDLHFIDAKTAMFALNNRIYVMTRADRP